MTEQTATHLPDCAPEPNGQTSPLEPVPELSMECANAPHADVPQVSEEQAIKNYVCAKIEERIKALDQVFQEIGKSLNILAAGSREFALANRELNVRIKEVEIQLKEKGLIK